MRSTPADGDDEISAAQPSFTAEERVAHILKLVGALNERDLSGYFACTTSDFEIEIRAADGAGQVVAGRRALRTFFESFFENWPGLTYEFVEGPDDLGGYVVSHDRWSARADAGERVVVAEFWAIGSFRGRACSRMDGFLSREEAFHHLEWLRGQGAGDPPARR